MNVDAPGPVVVTSTPVIVETPVTSNESDESNSTGMIVGITIGVTVLLIAIAIILLCLIILRKRKLNKVAL